METFYYHKTENKKFTKEFLDSKNKTKRILVIVYNISGDLSAIYIGKNFNFNGLYVFYSNKKSNITNIHSWFS